MSERGRSIDIEGDRFQGRAGSNGKAALKGPGGQKKRRKTTKEKQKTGEKTEESGTSGTSKKKKETGQI